MGTGTVRGAELWFGLLGPLEVRRGADPMRLGGERQRALLALLLLHPNRLVLTETIVEQLFGGQPSEATLNALWAAVSRLRKQLRQADGETPIARRPGGYLITVAPDQLDLTVFERLVDHGCSQRRAGDGVSAAATLREALELWRGAPFADLTGIEFAEPEIRRLHDLRRRAVAERIDADLSLGRDGSLVGEIEDLIDDDPLSERFRGQLMLALYRAGRQSDALEVYRQTHTLLRDELGLEPGPQLRALQELILRQTRRSSQPGRYGTLTRSRRCSRPRRCSARSRAWRRLSARTRTSSQAGRRSSQTSCHARRRRRWSA